jgi:hypothetical protein
MTTLAWIPFAQPVSSAIHWWWLLVVPMCLGISVTWKAVRLRSLDRYWLEVGFMTGQLLAGMGALAGALMVLARVVLPMLPAD